MLRHTQKARAAETEPQSKAQPPYAQNPLHAIKREAATRAAPSQPSAEPWSDRKVRVKTSGPDPGGSGAFLARGAH
jgi:hypothetical protein